MDIDALQTAVAVLRRGSFAAVARDQGLEPSLISRTISGLERDVGFRLFQRSTRRLAATEAGELYLNRAEGLLEALDDARHAALALSDKPAGLLRLTASVAFGTTLLIPLLSDFRSRHPGVQVELMLNDASLDLVAERVDLAVRLSPSYRGDLIGVRLMATRYRVCATPDYLARAGLPQTPAELAAHACLLFDMPDYRTRWRFRDAGGAVETVPVRGDILISNAFALYQALKMGLGPALLPSWLVGPDLAAGRLIDLFPDRDACATDFDTSAWLLYPSRSFLPSKTRVMIDFLKERLGSV